MVHQPLPLNAVHAFLVTTRHLNLTRAADELCLTQGAVSRKIAALEKWLGFTLFDRHARGLHLTTRGAAMLPQLKQGYELMLSATEQARQPDNALRLRAPSCAMRWLLPKLVQLEQQHPGLHVKLTTTLAHNYQLENFDAAIVYGIAPVGSHLLFEERLTPVMAENLLVNRPLDVASLASFTFLHPTNDERDWQLWLQAQEVELPMRRNQHFATMDLAIGAAIQGFGVTVADITLVKSDLAAQRLIAPFASAVKTGAAYSLISREEKATSPHLATLVAWLCQPD
ncbi:LysR family transcriptional regulator [Mixta theicola]|uniref:LysR family transcriptional regulator n=1 Tax=Mixta theicola TaxID=1458355 RepID=A0A2K1QDC1_9GAMM|nr:LysR substrate-binding domain-containing protein [Mixta theicola]PNS13034.1 LysR family transcriptional regulator [Mixta theicola]GLR09294.1 LysR family transcriptional regulator [Mixta theicola]